MMTMLPWKAATSLRLWVAIPTGVLEVAWDAME